MPKLTIDELRKIREKARGDRILSADGRYTAKVTVHMGTCLLYTSPSPRDRTRSRMPSSA